MNARALCLALRLALLPAALAALAAAGPARAQQPRVVEITARRFEFQPSQITLKAGEPVVLRVKSLDVTHGFYQKALGIDATIEPGKATDVPVTPKAPGRYVTICDHFCGSGHGNMKMTIVVE
jgi:cytochrome c oxidase subunit 2